MDEKPDEVDYLKIYSLDDEQMLQLGQIIKTFKSKKIFETLQNRELRAKEIGQLLEDDDNPRLPNIHHHLDKMVDIGLIASVTRMRNGHNLRYYTATSKMILLVPEKYYDKAIKSKTLKNTIKTVFKFAMLGVVAGGNALLSSIFINSSTLDAAVSNSNDVVIPAFVFIGSLIIGFFLIRKKL